MDKHQVSSLRAAALSTLRAKRRKPGVEKAALLRPRLPDSIQLDYGLEEDEAQVGHEPVSEDVEIREEGEISEEEEIAPPVVPQALKETGQSPVNEPKSPAASHFSPRRTPEASPVSPRHKPATQLTATQMALLSLDANHVRPGLQMTLQQYGTAKEIILDLLGWGVPPEFLVECGLSREIVFYVFVELDLRLPQNLDTAGLIPYTPESVAAAQKAAALSMEHESPVKASVADASSLHDMEMQRKQELLARKRAVIASRKAKATTTTTTTTTVSTDVDSFLKSISPPHNAMDVDDVPRPGIEKSDSMSSVGSSTSTASRRGTKRPVASDFVDLDTRPYHHAARSPAIDFGSVSNGNRRCVIDLSDSEEETEDMLRPDGEQGSTPGSSRTPPGGAIKERSQLELEIQRMKELIAMKERERLKKLASRAQASAAEEGHARDAGDAGPRGNGWGAYASPLAGYPRLGGGAEECRWPAWGQICRYEIPGGGRCRDGGCRDVHVGR